MNFSNFLVKHEKKRKKKRLVDDRPFSSIIDADERKDERILSHDRTGHWVNCARVRVDSDNDSDDDDSKFKSFNHYFVDEPIYSEPDLKDGIPESGNVSDDQGEAQVSPRAPAYDLVTRPRVWRASSTDSDYESFSLDRADMETGPGRRDNREPSTHFLKLGRNKIDWQLFSGFEEKK